MTLENDPSLGLHRVKRIVEATGFAPSCNPHTERPPGPKNRPQASANPANPKTARTDCCWRASDYPQAPPDPKNSTKVLDGLTATSQAAPAPLGQGKDIVGDRRLGSALTAAMTGNKTQPQLSGPYLQAVRFHRQVWPRATADEVSAFVAANVSPTIVFSRWHIYNADERLGLTSKRVSITASQAFTFEAQTRRRLFWTAPMPLGIFGVPLAELIDMDECALYVETVSRPTGKAYKGVRIRDSGPYKVGEKWTLILAVDAQGLIHAKFMR
ncbi:hypothetical protein B484DRAFT_398828, partial [Ochromonadaceae sp. CCMP2298]